MQIAQTGQKGEKITTGSKRASQVAHLFPLAVALARHRFAVGDAHFQRLIGIGHTPGLRPEPQVQRGGVQIGLPLEMQIGLVAGATDVRQGGKGRRYLCDITIKVVGAARLGFLPGRNDRVCPPTFLGWPQEPAPQQQHTKQCQQPQPPQRTGQRVQGTVVGEATGACTIWATLPQKLA